MRKTVYQKFYMIKLKSIKLKLDVISSGTGAGERLFPRPPGTAAGKSLFPRLLGTQELKKGYFPGLALFPRSLGIEAVERLFSPATGNTNFTIYKFLKVFLH